MMKSMGAGAFLHYRAYYPEPGLQYIDHPALGDVLQTAYSN